jgi:ankyrin repeat protein
MRNLTQQLAVILTVLFLPLTSVLADSLVADAAMVEDIERMTQLLQQGEDVNTAQGDGMTAIHWAAENGNGAIADMVIAAGANLDAITRMGGYSALHLASSNGAAEVVSALLAAGSDVMAETTTGAVTPLHFAAASGDVDVINRLVKAGAEVNAEESVWNQTPLMFAAAGNRLNAVNALIDLGAELEATSKVIELVARHAEDLVAKKRRDEVLNTFREESGSEAGTWAPDPSEVTAAIEAAREYITQQEVDIEEFEKNEENEDYRRPLNYTKLVGTQGGLTPLLLATREGLRDVSIALLDAGADINTVGAGDKTSPILMAILNGHFDLALILLERGADPTLASAAGTTPLYAVINTQWLPKARFPQPQAYLQQQSTYLELMKTLLDAGVDPNTRLNKHLWFMEYTNPYLDLDTNGATPFWRAAHALDIEAMKMLIEYGADPNIATIKPTDRSNVSGFKEDPCSQFFHFTLHCKIADIFDGLFGDPSGLPPVEEGGPAIYPIHAATGHGYGVGFAANSHRHVPDAWLAAVKYLVEEHGADVNERDHDGSTPLHNAASRGDNEMIHYLVEKGSDVLVINRKGQSTADLANGPVQRTQPYFDTVELLESLGSINNDNCVSC